MFLLQFFSKELWNLCLYNFFLIIQSFLTHRIYY